MSFIVLIPSRYNSTRLPGKPLLKIKGKSLIQRVYEKAILSEASSVFVVTDSQKIADHCNIFNAPIVMTKQEHATGTDRLAEAAEILELENDQVVVNLQGDEPFTLAEDINKVSKIVLENKFADMGTLYTKVTQEEDLRDVSKVKLLVDQSSKVHSFSRKSIVSKSQLLTQGIHIGIYSYKVSFLNTFVSFKRSVNEIKENLEQLRALEKKKNIFAKLSKNMFHLGIDTKNDLYEAEELIKKHGI